VNQSNRWLVLVLIGGVLLACITGMYFGLSSLLDFLSGLDRTVLFVTGASALTVWLSARVISHGIRNRSSQDHLIKCKAETYLRLLAHAAGRSSEGSRNDGDGGAMSKAECAPVERQLLLWGSVGVIEQYALWQKAEEAEFADAFERLLREMRKDLGQSSFGMDKQQLMAILGPEETGSRARR
jgi:hypothetical protein